MTVLLALSAAACGAAASGQDASESLTVSDVRVPEPPPDSPAAVYLTVDNSGDADDRLVGADTEAAERVELHTTAIDDDGTARMEMLEAMDLPAGGSLVAEPGGPHLMLIEPTALAAGDELTLTLTFAEAGEIEVSAQIVSPADAHSHDHDDHDDHDDDHDADR